MRDKQLCATIGNRMKERRKELNLNLGYIADKMGVNISTAQRYEAGLIDNSKKIVLDSLAEILHTTPEWLRGETSELNSDIEDYMELKLIDSFNTALKSVPDDLEENASLFSKNILLLLLKEYTDFNQSFGIALSKYTDNENNSFAETIGFSSSNEFNEVMFLREITHTINTFSEISDIIRTYSKNPDVASNRLDALLKLH